MYVANYDYINFVFIKSKLILYVLLEKTHVTVL